jgi:hypothetical protein
MDMMGASVLGVDGTYEKLKAFKAKHRERIKRCGFICYTTLIK